MLVIPQRLLAVPVMVSSKSVSICNCSHARRVSSDFIEGTLMFALTQCHEIFSSN